VLTDAELGQEFTRIINANNPHAPDNIVRFSHKEKEFKQTATVDHTAIHLSLDGNLLLLESDEGRRQKSRKSMA
jgi:dynein intermediate chain 1, axonemal